VVTKAVSRVASAMRAVITVFATHFEVKGNLGRSSSRSHSKTHISVSRQVWEQLGFLYTQVSQISPGTNAGTSSSAHLGRFALHRAIASARYSHNSRLHEGQQLSEEKQGISFSTHCGVFCKHAMKVVALQVVNVVGLVHKQEVEDTQQVAGSKVAEVSAAQGDKEFLVALQAERLNSQGLLVTRGMQEGQQVFESLLGVTPGAQSAMEAKGVAHMIVQSAALSIHEGQPALVQVGGEPRSQVGRRSSWQVQGNGMHDKQQLTLRVATSRPA